MARKRKTPISVNLDPVLAERLKLRAERKSLFISEYAREILIKELKND
tara:strand:+ start:388 stop:531 length:144 start_codon:yes stop_codon:yes gene_type:complete